MADPSAAVPEAARQAILAWYDRNGRPLPFRATRDPFAILVSEVIAQQTQAVRAADRWRRFMDRFPAVEGLAAATPADVLREWQGLGYNRRALNLWRAARVIVADHGGRVPDDVAALERLPGIGPYTARAVVAIAFGRPVGAVDVNVRRVLTRVAGMWDVEPAAVQALADAIVPAERAGDWTHAVMDIGARFCRPTVPRCGECPVATWCRWNAAALPSSGDTPVRRPAVAFASTRRWLRGRILDSLRAADGWTVLSAPLGRFEEPAVRGAIAAMAAEGLLEVDPGQPLRARLPLA